MIKKFSTNIMLLGIIHRPVFIEKRRLVYFSKNVSETGFCLRLYVTPTQLGPIDGAISG
jgi:hypothetical protein